MEGSGGEGDGALQSWFPRTTACRPFALLLALVVVVRCGIGVNARVDIVPFADVDDVESQSTVRHWLGIGFDGCDGCELENLSPSVRRTLHQQKQQSQHKMLLDNIAHIGPVGWLKVPPQNWQLLAISVPTDANSIQQGIVIGQQQPTVGSGWQLLHCQ